MHGFDVQVKPAPAPQAPRRVGGSLGAERWGRTIGLTMAESSRRSIATTLAATSVAWIGFCSILVAVGYDPRA